MKYVFALLFTAGILTGCSSTPKIHPAPKAITSKKHGMPMLLSSSSPSAHGVHGIDVSKYQGNIDWSAVRDDNIKFAFIKATEGGDRLDDKFKQNWQNAKDAGVQRGAYHFAYWCRSMDEQADWFIRNVPKDITALPPVFDVEWNNHSPTCPKGIPKDVALREMKVFLHKVEAHYGKKPVIYADINFHKDVLGDNELAEYPFWVRSVKHPIQDKYPGRHWSFWQYTATGKVAGIKGNVDRNVFAGNHGDWSRLTAMNFIEPQRTMVASSPVVPARATQFAVNEPSIPPFLPNSLGRQTLASNEE